MRGTREQCRAGINDHLGIVPAEPAPRPDTKATQAAQIEQARRSELDQNRQYNFQRRIKARGWRPPRGMRFTFIIGEKEMNDGGKTSTSPASILGKCEKDTNLLALDWSQRRR